MYHSRSKYKLYQQRKQATTDCPFCDPAEINYRLKEETDYAYIIPNQTPYEVWEQHKVLDHLLVIPKRHAAILSDLNDAELLDFSRVCARYEALGYSVYTRSSINPRRSVNHLHTHLIKIDTKQPRIHVYLEKPYVMVNF